MRNSGRGRGAGSRYNEKDALVPRQAGGELDEGSSQGPMYIENNTRRHQKKPDSRAAYPTHIEPPMLLRFGVRQGVWDARLAF